MLESIAYRLLSEPLSEYFANVNEDNFQIDFFKGEPFSMAPNTSTQQFRFATPSARAGRARRPQIIFIIEENESTKNY